MFVSILLLWRHAALVQIGNHTIKLSMLNKDSKWTKALKLMLANLKVWDCVV